MKILKNVEVPTNLGRNKLGDASSALVEFTNSKDKNMKVECETKREADCIYSTISGTARRYGLPVRVTRSLNDIYVIRKETE